MRIGAHRQKPDLFDLVPSKNIPVCDGAYIVHSGGKGSPHAVFLRISDGGVQCVVKDGADIYELSHELLEACHVKGYDKKTVVFFGVDVDHSGENTLDENSCLLKLLAGV